MHIARTIINIVGWLNESVDRKGTQRCENSVDPSDSPTGVFLRRYRGIANVGRGSRSMKFRCTFSFFLRSRSSFFQRKLKPTIVSRCDERIDGVRCSFRVVKEKLRTNREKREDKGNEDRRKKKKRNKENREKKEKNEGNGFFFAVPIDFYVVAITGGV